MKSAWQEEVARFRAWAATNDQQDMEWETEYGEGRWESLCQAVGKFLSSSTPENWTEHEIGDLFYLLARDANGWRDLPLQLRKEPAAALFLASKSSVFPEVEAPVRRELSDVLGYLPTEPRVEALLLRLADDEEESVRRYALQSLARTGSPQTEALALREWHRDHPNQQWARMMALACWHHIGSPLLEAHLQEAEVSPFAYLSYFARKMRNGELEPWQRP